MPKSENPDQERLWSETWKRINRFLPDLRKQLNLDVETVEVISAATVLPVAEEKPQNVDEAAPALS